ncbi:MAG: DUF177 domain-containing protein [Bacillati bacterium ANGP1]|uniref:DUF177 domain-containing protein n=1 Tax=Candidatus Segetimicrobium genomatis TaxID=2569760 RepID=A0A537JZW6_9BACT|nr:MAG: DUF177 domain-containing protein [Terrabacteria group bacterium ANGP1]
MRVNIGPLLADRGAIRTVAYSEWVEPPAEDATLLQPVMGELVLAGTGRSVCLTGRLRTRLSLDCGACLAGYEHPLEFAVAEEFRRAAPFSAAGAGGERELDSDDFVVPVGPDDTFDLTEVVRQHLVLALPIAPRCREDCRGLCATCGADLNLGSCACAGRPADARRRLGAPGPAVRPGRRLTKKE